MSDIAERIREARDAQQPLRIVGAGTWQSAGAPVRAERTLSVADHRGIVEYVPGDLTLTARAGTPLADITAATRAEGQWLPLDPWGGDAGTLGATLSTATPGPHAFATGLPRDIVLGVEFVTGTGSVVRAGGRVVKNVAGFDLTRMVIGSWGTLGVITMATVRLRARPERTHTIALAVAETHAELNALAVTLRSLPFTPLATELVNARVAAALGLGDRALLLVQAGGNERSVTAQLASLRTIGAGDARDVDDGVWARLRELDPPGAASWRWSGLPNGFGDSWTAADRSTRALGGALLHGHPMRGVVRVVAPDTTGVSPAALARAAREFGGTVVVERLPRDAWPHLGAPVAADVLSQSIRRTFDPAGVLNRGILGVA